MKVKYLFIGIALVVLAALALTACGTSPTATSAPTTQEVQTCPTAAPCPDCPTCPAAAVETVPYQEQWAGSGHNDAEAEAFNHWNEDDPAEVPASCATCHSTSGFQDFLGADGSAAGTVEANAPIGQTITCDACHNPASDSLSAVTFPSGVTISGLGSEARCMVCHQGRASSVQVDEQIAKFNATDPDAVVEPQGDSKFGFINIHYFAAAATQYGGETKGGYQYEGKSYDAKFEHSGGLDTCISCHDQHSLEVKVEVCAECHEGVATTEDLKNIRMVASANDYNGNGDTTEGMFYEIQGLQETLLSAIQAYAKDVVKTGVVYDATTYPYFLADANNDGQADQDDTGAAVGFSTWTPRLLKAAYNYQLSLKDPGAFAHGNKYIVQLLFDSIEDVNSALPTPLDTAALNREDAGHFAGDTEPFRHWDGEEMIVPGGPTGCVKCHTATGLPMFIDNAGSTISAHASNGFACSTCHDEANWPANYAVNTVTFPSGKSVTFGEGVSSNLCIMCHQGRESKVSVDKSIGANADKPNVVPVDAEGKPTLRFRNVHYFAAGATLFGTEAQGAYEYDGLAYVGMNQHPVTQCVQCHDKHTLEVQVETCKGCHGDVAPDAIRMTKLDYDGDGDTTEGVKAELEGMEEQLLAAMQAYTVTNQLPGIVYDGAAYPYWFEDADGDGKADVDSEGNAVAYSQWTPALVKAAYNYQYAQKDPGDFAHNSVYVAEFLFDSIKDVGGDVTKLTRPEPPAPAQ